MNEPELIEIEVPCEPCKGTEVCPRCEGRQKVTIETYIHGYCDIEIDCPECKGEGWVEREIETCPCFEIEAETEAAA